MDGFKTSMAATLFVVVSLFNGLLWFNAEAVRLYVRKADDGWTQDCFYYTPITVFSTAIDAAGDCPVRIRVPGARR